MRSISARVLWTIGLFLSGLATAQAQAVRTWVSGVGDDVNPCSRTAPCKTFAGAISKTANTGIISVLDPGGFGAVTITKSITIETDGAVAGVLASGANGIIVNDSATASPGTVVVILRGLNIQGGSTATLGFNGIRFLSGRSLTVENCNIETFSQNGIDIVPTSVASVLVRNTLIANTGISSNPAGTTYAGIKVAPTGAGSARVTLEGVRLFEGYNGVDIGPGGIVMARNIDASRNDGSAFIVSSAGNSARLALQDSVVNDNGAAGVLVSGSSATAMIGNNSISGNANGVLASSSGIITSFSTNRIYANTVNGAPNTSQAQQ